MARGLYCLSDLPPQTQPDLVTVSRKVPQAVICLVSALAFHELTVEVPHAVDVALPRGAEPPRLVHPPVHIYWFSAAAYTEGVEIHTVDGTDLRVYSPEKTLADCFKYRNGLGMETVLDALRQYRSKRALRVDELMRFARICRVHNVIRPYLEASL
jgi:predicted transcriptional regulator of viral defense system